MLGPCRICRREIRAGFGWSPGVAKMTVWTDSPRCAELAAKFYGKEQQMTDNEIQASRQAGKVAFRYLEKVGVTDLNEITREQFDNFCDAFRETYHKKLIEITGADNPPFGPKEQAKAA